MFLSKFFWDIFKMLKLQIANAQDRKEAQNRERRRQCELERRSRIFNARNRKIGVCINIPTMHIKIKAYKKVLTILYQRII